MDKYSGWFIYFLEGEKFDKVINVIGLFKLYRFYFGNCVIGGMVYFVILKNLYNY